MRQFTPSDRYVHTSFETWRTAHIRAIARVRRDNTERTRLPKLSSMLATQPCHRSGGSDPHRGRYTILRRTSHAGACTAAGASEAQCTCAALAALCLLRTLPRLPPTCDIPSPSTAAECAPPVSLGAGGGLRTVSCALRAYRSVRRRCSVAGEHVLSMCRPECTGKRSESCLRSQDSPAHELPSLVRPAIESGKAGVALPVGGDVARYGHPERRQTMVSSGRLGRWAGAHACSRHACTW